MPSKSFNLPHNLISLNEPSAAKMIQQNFEALAKYLDGKIGTYKPSDIQEIEEDAAFGLLAWEGTQVYRAEGAPTNDPSPTGISQVHAPNGTMLLTLGWTYEQGDVPADFLLLFRRWHQSTDPGDAQATDPAIAIKPTEGASAYTFEGLNPSYKWSFAVAAARKTEAGLEIGPLQSVVSWVNVTIGTPNFAGTVDGTPAETVSDATSNFNTRNDRKGTVPEDPLIVVDGTAVDHVINDDGSADISFEWLFEGLGDAGDIDGFVVYVRMGATNTPYLMGTSPEEEQVFYLPASVRAHILRGVRADGYYTFGVQAYRDVDQDIDLTGRIESAIVQPSIAGENPYQPSTSVEFRGNITGTIDGVPVATLLGDLGTALQEIADLHDQVDGSISAWFYEYAPTTANLPASDWTTEALKIEHLGDVFYDLTTGYSYRWIVQNSVYAWVRITDSDVTKALADAATAQDTADSKRRVFIAQPVPPYDAGDLWRVEGEPDLKICVTQKAEGQAYSANDWALATDAQGYTDDAIVAVNLLVDQAMDAAQDAQATADGKITTFVLPSTTPPTADAVGDLWIVTDQQNNLFRWDGSEWEDIRDLGIPHALLAAGEAQDTADGKIVTFFQDAPPVATAVGDLWFDTNDGNKPYRAASAGADQIAPGEWEDARDRAAANFDSRNDRIATAPANPTIVADGTAVDHSIGQTGAADISFEWGFSGSGDAYDIDGFLVYIMARSSSAAYAFGTSPQAEEVVMLPKEKLFHILRGVDPTLYYTFGIQAYRVVDPDIDASGVKKSAIVKPSLAGENPYHPASNTAWPGDVTGTVGGTPVERVANLLGFGDGSDGALNTTGNVTFDVAVDGEPVVKHYTSVTINAGHIVTVSNRCKGLIILCQGNVVINGELRMDDKAAEIGSSSAPGTSMNLAITTHITNTFTYMLIPAGGAGGSGGGGGTTVTEPGGLGGKAGTSASLGGSGGGGGGGGAELDDGGMHYTGGNGGDGAGNGGDGGLSGSLNRDPTAGGDGGHGGGGGIIAIIAGGSITIGATGVVSASAILSGSAGYKAVDTSKAGGGGGGGGAGGGVIVMAYHGAYANYGSILVNGSAGGAGGQGSPYGQDGSNGQVGSIITLTL